MHHKLTPDKKEEKKNWHTEAVLTMINKKKEKIMWHHHGGVVATFKSLDSTFYDVEGVDKKEKKIK
jgi:hypothetical protein